MGFSKNIKSTITPRLTGGGRKDYGKARLRAINITEKER